MPLPSPTLGYGNLEKEGHKSSSSPSSNYSFTGTASFSSNHTNLRIMSGVLYKWVNFCHGWKRRWFVLEDDGVLSYYKIRHAPIHSNNPNSIRTKPLGEIHLKVSSVHETKHKNSKRFSIFTGTKRLHLRAHSPEDRMHWVQALQTMKDLFPRTSNARLSTNNNDTALQVSTNKLRQRLMEEGVNEAVIQESERIMKTEFSALNNQLLVVVDTLRKLELSINITTIRSNQHRKPSGQERARFRLPRY